MKSEHLYQHLKDFTERMGIAVSEQNLKSSGVPTKSGFCVVKGKPMFILDKHRSIRDKAHILAAWLAHHAADRIHDEYIVPAAREVLERFQDK